MLPPDWLVPWIPLLQIATNATLTLVAITIAAISLIVAYRNNFGWKPIVIVGRSGYRGTYRVDDDGKLRAIEGQPRYRAKLGLEVWNRRKYPIVVRKMVIVVQDLELIQTEGHVGGGWMYSNNTFGANFGTSVPASSTERHLIELAFNGDSPEAVRARLSISIDYYDPRKDRVLTMKRKAVFSITGDIPYMPYDFRQDIIKDE
jgi:hypothetical protein